VLYGCSLFGIDLALKRKGHNFIKSRSIKSRKNIFTLWLQTGCFAVNQTRIVLLTIIKIFMGTFKLSRTLFLCLSVSKKHIDIRYSLAFNLIFDVFGKFFSIYLSLKFLLLRLAKTTEKGNIKCYVNIASGAVRVKAI